MIVTRRTFIHTASVAAAGMNFPVLTRADGIFRSLPKHEICLFSKHLQYLNFNEMSEILARTGFDGIDLTVRPGGHIEPENTERDLLEAVKAAQSAGLAIPMMTTNITDPNDKISQKVLEIAADNGVKYYRIGSMGYDLSISIEKNINTNIITANNLLSFRI